MSILINGAAVPIPGDPRVSLLDLLRETLHLSGTKKGCNQGACGACTVLVDGERILSCLALAVQYDEREVMTIEGLADGETLHPMQAAFREHHGLQCGFCTPGMVIAGIEIVRRRGHDLDAETIAHDLEGNLCRCTGYVNIIKAIQAGAKAMETTHA